MTSDSSGPAPSIGSGAEVSRGTDRVELMKSFLSGPPEHRTAGLEWFTPGRFAFILAACIFAAYPEVVLGMRTVFLATPLPFIIGTVFGEENCRCGIP